jgi:hypothetical protein
MLLFRFTKFFENPYRDDLAVKINFIGSLVINIIIWVILYSKLHHFAYATEDNQIYLHYNIYFGIDNIGIWYYVFILPVLGIFIIALNNILAYFFYLKDKFISYSLIVTQTAIQLVLLSAAIFVILLNI